MNDFSFCEKTHQYFYKEKRVPSVTGVLKSVGLVDDTWFTEESCTRGKHVHLACEYYDKGCLDFDSLEEQYKPYVNAYIQFTKDHQPIWKLIEYKNVNRHLLYGFTLDRLGLMSFDETLLDIKTGGVSLTTGVQLAGYELGLDTLDDSPFFVKKRMGLYLKSNGKYRLIEYKNRQDYTIFKNAMNITHWKWSNL